MNDVRSGWTFRRAAALDRLDDDAELLVEIIKQFLADAPAALAAIEGAIEREDGTALADAAHTLKGAAGYLAADDLCLAAQQLEGFGRTHQADAARHAWPDFSRHAVAVIAGLRESLPRP